VASAPIRDQAGDHLIARQNATLVWIDSSRLRSGRPLDGLARVRATARLEPLESAPQIVEIVLTERLLKE
jgi:hypothetical protein